jgi:hypothetical protein
VTRSLTCHDLGFCAIESIEGARPAAVEKALKFWDKKWNMTVNPQEIEYIQNLSMGTACDFARGGILVSGHKVTCDNGIEKALTSPLLITGAGGENTVQIESAAVVVVFRGSSSQKPVTLQGRRPR